MNKERTVFVVTLAGEQFIAEHTGRTRSEFDSDASDFAVTLKNVRRFVVQHIEGRPDVSGRVPVTIAYTLMNIDPFPGAVPEMRARLSRWVHLGDCDNPELQRNLDTMLNRAIEREAIMRATAAGLSVPAGKE